MNVIEKRVSNSQKVKDNKKEQCRERQRKLARKTIEEKEQKRMSKRDREK